MVYATKHTAVYVQVRMDLKNRQLTQKGSLIKRANCKENLNAIIVCTLIHQCRNFLQIQKNILYIFVWHKQKNIVS